MPCTATNFLLLHDFYLRLLVSFMLDMTFVSCLRSDTAIRIQAEQELR